MLSLLCWDRLDTLYCLNYSRQCPLSWNYGQCWLNSVPFESVSLTSPDTGIKESARDGSRRKTLHRHLKKENVFSSISLFHRKCLKPCFGFRTYMNYLCTYMNFIISHFKFNWSSIVMCNKISSLAIAKYPLFPKQHLFKFTGKFVHP